MKENRESLDLCCDEREEQLSALVDGDLDAGEREAVEAHLEVCPRCRAVYEDLNEMTRSLRALGPVPERPNVLPKVAATVNRGRRRMLLGLGGAVGLAASVLVVLLLLPGQADLVCAFFHLLL